MRIAYFDCFSGISGDMILGALIDAGLDLGALQSQLQKLGLPGFRLEAKRAERHQIAATRVEVITTDEPTPRGPKDIQSVLQESHISEASKTKAENVFDRLAEAEAKVHNIPKDDVHFHEVGAVDAIVDIAGTVVGLELLGVEQVYASALRLGTGVTRSAHGAIPIPSPATLELTRDVPVIRTDIPAELVTPTGAALITTLAAGFGAAPLFRSQTIGYGAGSRDLPQLPNLLRVQVGEQATLLEEDQSVVVETNIDDMSPEVYAYVLDRLLSIGAKDAFLTPAIMKKGRPGTVLTVLADQEHLSQIVQTIFEETTTLGVRIYDVERKKVTRTAGQVRTPYGIVKTKIAEFGGQRRQSPEYEDCVRLAREAGVPLLEIYRAAQGAQERDGKGADE